MEKLKQKIILPNFNAQNKGHIYTKQVNIQEGWEELVKNCDGAKH